jgi:hypothetical protein
MKKGEQLRNIRRCMYHVCTGEIVDGFMPNRQSNYRSRSFSLYSQIVTSSIAMRSAARKKMSRILLIGIGQHEFIWSLRDSCTYFLRYSSSSDLWVVFNSFFLRAADSHPAEMAEHESDSQRIYCSTIRLFFFFSFPNSAVVWVHLKIIK